MKENPVYKSYFEDLGPIEPQEDVPTVLPADPEPEASVETTPEALVDEIMKELE